MFVWLCRRTKKGKRERKKRSFGAHGWNFYGGCFRKWVRCQALQGAPYRIGTSTGVLNLLIPIWFSFPNPCSFLPSRSSLFGSDGPDVVPWICSGWCSGAVVQGWEQEPGSVGSGCDAWCASSLIFQFKSPSISICLAPESIYLGATQDTTYWARRPKLPSCAHF